MEPNMVRLESGAGEPIYVDPGSVASLSMYDRVLARDFTSVLLKTGSGFCVKGDVESVARLLTPTP